MEATLKPGTDPNFPPGGKPGSVPGFEAWRLRLPLERPYKLAFGPVAALDTVVVRVVPREGGEGYGEATLLTGYTDETIEGAWATATALVGSRAPLAQLEALSPSQPFIVTAFRTAIEMAASSPRLSLDSPSRVPILGLLQGETLPALEREAEALLAQGYATLKFKVGFDPARDAALVSLAQRAVGGRAAIRIDANQGYTAAQAVEFVSRLDPAGIELFEQPCKAGDWDAHMAVVPAARDRGIALMLDEGIYDERDIEEAARRGAARFIKVKLMKLGSLEGLVAAIARIRELGMAPVLGNGVAADLGCWMEACVAARHIDNAGEMNGFLKPRARLLAPTLAFRDGAIELPARWSPALDPDMLERHAIGHVSSPKEAV